MEHWCCVMASLQAGVPSVSFLCRHILPCFGLNSTPGSLGLGCAGVTLLLLMLYIKIEMNILSKEQSLENNPKWELEMCVVY